ncbi:transmembrane protein, putative [Medicago truncatula]|uniref:Transmembrane protein, putative n=1 Tax=Medicago truncatula TaxID=3880 RepID=G7K2H5_MEDTR|nr:transmembrane protein, putative [Medicago truncatula]
MLYSTNYRLLFLLFLLFLISVPSFQHKCLASAESSIHGKTFKRPDPLRHFKDYNGEFDVRNKHYLASAAFTGVHGYAFAGVWLFFGVALGIFMIVRCLCGGSLSLPCLDHYYLHIFVLLLLLASLAIVASSFVLATSQKTIRRTEKLKDTVVGIGEEALGAINRNSTTDDLRTNSRVIRRFIDKSEQSFNKAIDTLHTAHIVVLTVNLVTLVAALVLMLLHWRPGFIILILCLWILTSLCWFLTGFDYFLHTFANDACSAFEDFENNPQNSSLGSMLPCINDSFSGKLIAQIGSTIHTFIVELNSDVSLMYQLLGIGEENEELIGLVKICNPFSGPPNYSYSPHNCPRDAIRIGDLPKVLVRFTCHQDDTKEECRRNGRFLPQTSYNMAHAYSRSIQDMLDIYPDLQKLSKCAIVKNKAAEIVSHQCKPIRKSTKLLWASMMSLSIIMVVLVFTWVVETLRCWDKPLSTNTCFRTHTSR